MQIQQRPNPFSPVGGLYSNPVRYRIATATAFVSVEVLHLTTRYGETTATSIGKFRADARKGVAVLDISSLLRGAMNTRNRTTVASLKYSCIFTDAIGAVLNDSANMRLAVLAARSFGTDTYAAYTATAGKQNAKFATMQEQPVLFEGQPMQLNVAVGNMFELIFEREYLGATGNTLLIRSDYVENRNAMLSFHIESGGMPAGTRYIKARLTNEYRATGGGDMTDWLDEDFITEDWY